MILKRKQYESILKDIKSASAQCSNTSTASRRIDTDTNYVYTAKVTLSTNTATGSTATVWVYQAKILWTPFGKTDLDAWELSIAAKAGDTDLLLSKYDLAAHGTDVIYLPCVRRGFYFENLLSGAGGGTVTVDDASINYNTADELQIYGFETGLPAAAKSIAEILMGL
jgi:hypothetical protein